MPSQHCLPEQGRDTPSAPRSTVGTRKPLAPKCQIVVFLYKKQNKKKVVTCHSNKTGIHYTQETHAHGQISKFTSSRIGKAEPSAPPPPSGNQPLSKPSGSEHRRPPPHCQSRTAGPREATRGSVATSPGCPELQPEPWSTCRPSHPLRGPTQSCHQHNVTSARPPLWPSALRPHNQKQKGR